MPSYIGKEPQQAYNSPDKDRFSGDGSTTEFTLSRTVAHERREDFELTAKIGGPMSDPDAVAQTFLAFDLSTR